MRNVYVVKKNLLKKNREMLVNCYFYKLLKRHGKFRTRNDASTLISNFEIEWMTVEAEKR